MPAAGMKAMDQRRSVLLLERKAFPLHLQFEPVDADKALHLEPW